MLDMGHGRGKGQGGSRRRRGHGRGRGLVGHDGGGAMEEAQGVVGPRRRIREAGISPRRGGL